MADRVTTRPRSEVAIVIPMIDEEAAMPGVIANIAALDPAPAEVIVVDGGSGDRSVEIARAAGFRVVEHGAKGRAVQINRGVAECKAPLVCVLHADTELPADALALVDETAHRDQAIAVAEDDLHELGDLLGISPVHVQRTMGHLRDAGHIVLQDKNLRIPDFPALAALGEFDPAYLHLGMRGAQREGP